MKKVFAFCMVSLALTSVFTFTSCGGDDDDNGGSGAANPGVLTDDTNGSAAVARVTAVGNYRFYYKDNGKLDYFYFDSNKYSFKDDNTVSYQTNNEDATIRLSYNKSGYIASFSDAFSGSYDGDTWSATFNGNLSYDGSGHLTRITVTGQETGTDDGERYTGNMTGSLTLTWKDNTVANAVWSGKYTEGGYVETEEYTYVYSYNDNTVNKLLQMPYSYWEAISDAYEDISALSFVGLMGKGPAKLPNSVKVTMKESEDGDEYSNERTQAFSYGFNSNGTIAYNSVGSSRYNYSYDYSFNDEATAKPSLAPVANNQPKKGLLSKSHHRWNAAK